eukprot:5830154-Alexandrium_andersonii.AAC.1
MSASASVPVSSRVSTILGAPRQLPDTIRAQTPVLLLRQALVTRDAVLTTMQFVKPSDGCRAAELGAVLTRTVEG